MFRLRHPFCLALLTCAALSSAAPAACCYFSAKNADILQPAQKVFLTYDPAEKVETFTVQPKFEGNALDFGMVIPTPNVPKLHEMPKEFFKHLAVYTILRQRKAPASKLLPVFETQSLDRNIWSSVRQTQDAPLSFTRPVKPPVRVLETGVVGSLDYKILEADRADALFAPRVTWAAWKDRQGGFVHAGLPGGKYLVYVSIDHRFVDWQVIDVTDAKGKTKLSFAIDLTEAGQLEVEVPDADKRTYIRLGPLDKDGKPPMRLPPSSLDFLNVITVPVVKGKAVLDKVKPGRYLVSREFVPLLKDCISVEVTKGKTSKVRLERSK